MNSCERLRPVLFRVSEAEASPHEAILVARHVSGCTACRILLARERRLGEILECQLHDRLPVGEDFVDAVMATLPEGPPPSRRAKRHLRLLKLASMGGVGCFAFLAILQALPTLHANLSLDTPAAPALEGAGDALGSLFGLLRMALLILAAVSDTLPHARGFPSALLPAVLVTLLPVLLGAALGLCGLAAGTVFGLGRRVRP